MSLGAYTLLTATVDGQTKTGKGAASQAIADTLRDAGYSVYYDVAGDFYRRYVALVRLELGLSEDEKLPTVTELERAAKLVHERRDAFKPDADLGDLQRPAISNSVSVLGELPLAQQAGSEWWRISLENALTQHADVFVVDGRNPRDRIREAGTKVAGNVQIALDLYMRCDPAEAARRNLLIHADHVPTAEEIEVERSHIEARRNRDLERIDYPFLQPVSGISFDAEHDDVSRVLEAAWAEQDDMELPQTIVLDNTNIAKDLMIRAVCDLALQSVERAKLR